jgi:hypothetical protein
MYIYHRLVGLHCIRFGLMLPFIPVLVILPIIMQRLEKYKFMQVRTLSYTATSREMHTNRSFMYALYGCIHILSIFFPCFIENYISSWATPSDVGGRVVSRNEVEVVIFCNAFK